MIDQRVRIDDPGQSGQEYRITRLLGSGFLGAVYAAQAELAIAGVASISAALPDKIAVKSPHAQLSDELRKRFWQEYDTLKRIRSSSAGAGSHVPAVWRGSLVSTGAAATGAVLCMELVQGNELTTYFEEGRDANGRPYYGLPEPLALAIGEQYAELVVALERAGISCADRKVHDLYWDGETSRLTVLDWNVVEMASAPGSAPGSTVSRTNIAVFGRLWFELLTGALPPLPDERNRRPFDSVPAWKNLSQGTRALVEKALAAAGAGFADARALQTAVSTHRRDFDRLASDGEFRTLAYAAESAVKNLADPRNSLLARLNGLVSAPGGPSADLLRELQPLLNDYNQKLANAERLVDLIEIKANQGHADAKQSATKLRPILQQSKFVERDPVKQLEHQLEMRNYPQAGQSAQVLGELFKGVGDYNNHLYVARWKMVAEAGDLGLKDSPAVYLSDYMTDLVALLGAMEREEWVTAQAQWKTFAGRIRAISERVRTPLDWLGGEIEVWLALQRAVVAERTGADTQVVAKVQEARTPIANFPAPYRDALNRVIDQSDWKERADIADKRSKLGDQLALDGADATLWREIDEDVKAGHFASASQRPWLWRYSERTLGGVQISQEIRRRLDDTAQLLDVLQSLDKVFHDHDWEVLLTPDIGLLDRARKLLEQAATSETCRRTLRDKLVGVLTSLAQAVERLTPVPPPARPSGQEWSTLSGVSSSLSVAPPPQAEAWGFVANMRQAEELLAWVRPLHQWQNSSAIDLESKRAWIKGFFAADSSQLGDHLWRAGDTSELLQMRLNRIRTIREEYETARSTASSDTKAIVARAEAMNVELVDGEAASVTRQKQEWIDFLTALRSEDIEKPASALSQYDARLQRMVAQKKEIEQAQSAIEDLRTSLQKIEDYQHGLPSLEKAAGTALLAFEMAQAQQLLAALDNMSISEFRDSADSQCKRVAELLERASRRRGQTDAVTESEFEYLRHRLEVTENQSRTLNRLFGDTLALLINVDMQTVVTPNQVERAKQEMKKLDVNNRPACVQRLLKKLEDDQSQDALAQFQAKVQGWWQSWSTLGSRAPSKEGMGASSVGKGHEVMRGQQSLAPPAADLDALEQAVENWQKGITLSGADRIIAGEIVLAWNGRLEAVKALDARIRAISDYVQSHKPSNRWFPKPKTQDPVNAAVVGLRDFPPEVLWLRQSDLERLAASIPIRIPAEIEQKINRGGRLVGDRR